MNLLKQKLGFWSWFFRVMRVFFQTHPLATSVVVGTTALSRITSFLAMLMPLKVILLAGSEGVPRYLRFFVEPDDKMFWVLALSAAAILLYIGTVILEAISKRLAQLVSGVVIQEANEISVISNQEGEGQSHYARFCQIAANSIYALVALAILIVANPTLAGFLSMAVIAQFGFTWWALSGTDDINPGRLKLFVTEKLHSYLSVLVTINILAAFLIILMPFIQGAGGNILLAIIGILLTRQLLGSLSSSVRTAVALEKRHHRINTLVFRDFQLEEKEKKYSAALRDLFSKDDRNRMVVGFVEVEDGQSVHTIWEDSSIPFINTFEVRVITGNGDCVRRYQQQIYPPKRVFQLENEEFLFRHVSRNRLLAPKVIARFSQGPFECQLCEYGSGVSIGDNWKLERVKLFTRVWSCKPPESVVRGFSASRQLLHQRLNYQLIQRLGVAIDDQAEREGVQRILESLEGIQSWLRKIPLCLANPELSQENVVKCGADETGRLIMSWGRWALEPLGADQPASLSEDELGKILKGARDRRDDVSESLTLEDLLFVNDCWNLDRLIRTERYKAAVGMTGELLNRYAGLREGATDMATVRSA